jgi:hypothetical protein
MPQASLRERFCVAFETSCATVAPLHMTTTNNIAPSPHRDFLFVNVDDLS